MWKLCKQQVDELNLITESDSLNCLKSEARSLAIKDGCLHDEPWVHGEELKNYELAVIEYKLIIREW